MKSNGTVTVTETPEGLVATWTDRTGGTISGRPNPTRRTALVSLRDVLVVKRVECAQNPNGTLRQDRLWRATVAVREELQAIPGHKQ